MKRLRAIFVLGVLLAVLLAGSGWFLVVNEPQHADVIVVLAGETETRPELALKLLQQGYAPRVILDVPAGARIYQWTQTELAKKYLESLPQAAAISVCPIEGLSTRDEAHDVELCLQGIGAKQVLLVTSSYHTRRARWIFRRQLRDYSFSVAAAEDPREFGEQWWRHREWAKTNFNEWMKLAWWTLVDRWR